MDCSGYEVAEWEGYKRRVCETIEISLDELKELWTVIGIRGQLMIDRCNQALDHYKDLASRMYEEDTILYENLVQKNESYSQTIKECCEQLNIPEPVFEDCPPLLLKHQLSLKVEELTKLRQSRLDELDELRTKEHSLCKCMSVSPHTFELERPVPAENDLAELRQHIDMLLAEKETRLRKYFILQSEILRTMQTLQKQPITVLEEEMCREMQDESEVQLSQEWLTSMKQLSEKLKKEKESNTRLLEELTQKLSFLWDCLQTDQQYRETFLKEHAHCGQLGLGQMEMEIVRCQELRIANMGHIIASLRRELMGLWDKCQASEDQRQAFQIHMTNDDVCEELLKIHEKEVLFWRNTFQTFEVLFQKVDKISQLFEKAKELQQRMTNPKRFQNRGGQLLVEEKERKKLMLHIPKMEEELLEMAAQYQDTVGVAFTVGGLRLEEYLHKQWDVLQQEKENDKLQRKQRKEELLSTTPKKIPRTNSTLTPFRTPGTGASIRGMTIRSPAFKSPGTTLIKTTPLKPMFRENTRTLPGTGPRRSPRINGTPHPKSTMHVDSAASMITYESFQGHLTRNANKRSTLNSTAQKVLGSKVTPVFTCSGSKRQRFSNGRSPRLNQKYSPTVHRKVTPSKKVRPLTTAKSDMPVLF